MAYTSHSIYCRSIKRLLDIVIAVAAILLLSPLIFLIAVLVRTRLGSPILFCQERPGKEGIPFKMFKFRTMTDACDKSGNLLSDSQRLTPFGSWLRSTSLDELPELWNVLRGEMSLVGPRPLLMDYLPLYSQKQRRRHHERPGLTGLAQVKGRNAISWEEKFSYDLYYVDNCSFMLDASILLMTIFRVIRRDSINASGHVTMPRFLGNQETKRAEGHSEKHITISKKAS